MVVNDRSLITQFAFDARDDLTSPTTSTFANKVTSYRDHVNQLTETLTVDQNELQKLCRACTEVYNAAKQLQQAELNMVEALDSLSRVKTSKDTNGAHFSELQQLHMGAALTKFSVFFKDLASLTAGVSRSLHNNLVFPLDELLKVDLKDKMEARKSVEGAWKDYENKLTKVEKDIKKQAKERGWTRSGAHAGDLASPLSKERTILQFEMCEFFLAVHKLDDRKSLTLLQHFIDFYHNQQSLHRDALACLDEYSSYIDGVSAELDNVKRTRDIERAALFELHSTLKASPHVLQSSPARRKIQQDAQSAITSPRSNATTPNRKSLPAADHSNEQQTHRHSSPREMATSNSETQSKPPKLRQQSTNPSPHDISGFLCKKSAGKLHKQWQKRYAELRNETFYLAHSDNTRPPVEVNMITCKIERNPEDARCFSLISSNRTYHFQADDEISAHRWTQNLERAVQSAQLRCFRLPSLDDTDAAAIRRQALQTLKQLPDVTWLSLTLGCIVCIDCSGCHRELGVQISRIQSITLDTITPAELLVPLVLYNDRFNSVLECELPTNSKLRPKSTDHERRAYIKSKYVDKRYVDKADSTDMLSAAVHAASVTDLLRYIASDLPLHSTVDMVKGGDNALTYICRNDTHNECLPMVELLLSNGFDPNTPTVNGEYAVHICVENDRVEHLKLLLRSRRIDLTVRNTRDQTALEFAYDIKPNGVCIQWLKDMSHESETTACRSRCDAVNIPLSLLGVADEITTPTTSTKLQAIAQSRTPAAAGGSTETTPIAARVMDETDLKFRHLSTLSSTRGSSSAAVDNSAVNGGTTITTTPTTTTGTNAYTSFQMTPGSGIKQPRVGGGAASSNRTALLPPHSTTPTSNDAPLILSGVSAPRHRHVKSPSQPHVPTSSTHPHAPPPLPPKRPDLRMNNSQGSADLANRQYRKPTKYLRSASDYNHGDQLAFTADRSLDNEQTGDNIQRHRAESHKEQKTHEYFGASTSGGNQMVSTLPMTASKKHHGSHLHASKSNAGDTQTSFRPAEVPPPVPLLPRPPAHPRAASLRRCRALYDCEPDNQDELGFKQGDTIVVTREQVPGEDDTWMEGHVDGSPTRRGIFPVTFVSFEI